MTDDSTKQPCSRLAPPPRIEWRAIASGVAVGFALSVVWREILLSFSTYFSNSLKAGPDWLLDGIGLPFLLAKGVAVGFVAARITHSRPYLHAFDSLFFQWVIVTSIDLFWMPPDKFIYFFPNISSLRPWLIMLLGSLLSVAGAFYGAYMAQSFKRTRGAQID